MRFERGERSTATASVHHCGSGPVTAGGGRAVLLLFLLLLFLTSCGNPLDAGTSAAPGSETPAALQPGLSPSVGPTSTPDPLLAARARALQLLAGMSLDQQLGQLIVVEYLGNSYQGSGLQYMVTQQYIGGILYQFVNHNFTAPQNTVSGMAAFSQRVQQDAKIPLLLGTDQEGGQVNRLAVFHGPLPSAAAMAATGNPGYAYAQGAQAARWLNALGINSDLAPVVDVHTVDPPVLQDRMFGSTPLAVETYAGAYLDGLQQQGVAGCLKHFPGLGAVTSDPHAGLPTITRSLSDLQRIDLAPYRAMIDKNHPAMIMDTDVMMPAIDPLLPAELSPRAINGLLRGSLGYNGVVITDGLYMHGISERWSLSQAATLAIAAGNDLIEGPYSAAQVASVLTAFKQALHSGQLSLARIEQSVARILLLKIEYGMLK
ncbi:MAG TPA: glycoside hydrolase family 3 N-terminal domain-containing protein [Ktedonobacteraceae bacterium]